MNRKKLLSFGLTIMGLGIICFGLWGFDPRLGIMLAGLGLLLMGIGVI